METEDEKTEDESAAPALREQWYVATQRIGGDGEVWMPGSLIKLDDRRARILIEKQVVTPHIGTEPPEPEPPAIIVHEPLVANGGE